CRLRSVFNLSPLPPRLMETARILLICRLNKRHRPNSHQEFSLSGKPWFVQRLHWLAGALSFVATAITVAVAPIPPAIPMTVGLFGEAEPTVWPGRVLFTATHRDWLDATRLAAACAPRFTEQPATDREAALLAPVSICDPIDKVIFEEAGTQPFGP